MDFNSELYVVDKQVLSEVAMNALEARKLLETGQVRTALEACKTVGISRSAYYKYNNMIFKLQENLRGKAVTFALDIVDTQGILSVILGKIAELKMNVLTINWNIPINGVSHGTLTIETGPDETTLRKLEKQLKSLPDVLSIRVVSIG